MDAFNFSHHYSFGWRSPKGEERVKNLKACYAERSEASLQFPTKGKPLELTWYFSSLELYRQKRYQ